MFDAEAKRLTLSGGALTFSDAAALAEYTLKIALKTDKNFTLFTLPAAKGTGLADGAGKDLHGIFTVGYGTFGSGWQNYGRTAAVFE